MASLNDPPVHRLLAQPNHAVVCTLNPDGSILSTMAWIDFEDGELAVNSAIGRKWPSNLQRDPRITVVVFESPAEFVSIRGTVRAETGDAAERHIDRLAKKYLDKDEYPFRTPGEERIRFVISPEHVRHVQMG